MREHDSYYSWSLVHTGCNFLSVLLLPSVFCAGRAQISPRPGFVLKTKLVDKGMKVFVNVCQHERIGESGMVKKLDTDGQEVRWCGVMSCCVMPCATT